MATRFRLTSDATAPAVSPTAQTYTHDQAVRRKLLLTDTSTLTTSAYTPDAADDLVAGDALHIQFVSAPLNAGAVFTSGDTLKWCTQGLEAHAGNNLGVAVFVSVVDSAGTTVQATLRTKSPSTTELPGTLNSRFKTTTLTGTYTLVAGDRLVVEFYVVGTPTAAGGVQGHNGSIRWGSGGAAGDLLENDTQTGTTLDPWIEFATTVTEESGTGHTANPSDVEGLLDTATQVADYVPAQTDPLGLVDSAAQIADYAPVVTDPLGLLDSTVQATDHLRDLTDNLGLVDDVTYEATGSIDRTVTDPLGIVETGQVDIYYPADPLGLADLGTVELTREADNLGMVDSVSYVFDGSQTQTFTDPLGIDFSGQVDIYYEADPLALADETLPVTDYQRSVTDPLGLTDSATYQMDAVHYTATITDNLGLVDSVTAAVGVAATITDLLGLVDSVTTTAAYLSTVTDLLGLTDSVAGQITGIGFWTPDPTGYIANPAGYTKNPVAYVPVGPDDTPPW